MHLPPSLFLHATYAANTSKNSNDICKQFYLLKRIYYEIFLVVKSHCLSLVHALYTLHCTVYEVLRGLIKTKKDREFNTPLQPSNCRSISNMHSCVYFTNLRFYGMHIIIRRNRYNRTFRRYPMCLVYILKAYYLYWICRPVVRGKVCTMQNATGFLRELK